MSAWATALVPAAKAAISNTPIGPFQNTVLEPRMISANAADGVRTDVEPELVARDRVGRDDRGGRVSGELRRDDDVRRQHQAYALLGGLLDVATRDVELVLLEERLADLVALRLEEREDHPATDQQVVGLVEQVVDHAELVGDLGPAEHHGVGTLGALGQTLEHVDLGLDQPTDG